MGDGKFRHLHRSIGKIRRQQRSGRSCSVDDAIFRPPHFSDLRHAWLF
jgi:hypothetical protein